MIYGNHDMKKSDVVKIAKWDEELILRMARAYDAKPETISDAKFYIADIDYSRRTIGVIPIVNSKLCAAMYDLCLDDTNLIRVGRLYEA